VAEVAELLRLNQQTVRNWIDQGSLPALRVGRSVRIKRSDLDRLLSEGYSARSPAGGLDAGPSAEDFWGGEPVGFAEPADSAPDEPAASAPDEAPAELADSDDAASAQQTHTAHPNGAADTSSASGEGSTYNGSSTRNGQTSADHSA
jgi:excisionase family DNA binding protein